MHINQNREQGFLLPTVVIVLAMLMLLGTIVLVKSTSEMRQAGLSQNQAQARGYAEAGQADMFYYVANPGIGVIDNILKPYSTAFSRSNSDSSTTAIIPTTAYADVLKAIQSAFSTISSTGTGYSSTSSITFRSLRADAGSFNKDGQSYYLDYSIVGRGNVGDNQRTVTTEGTMRVNMGRQSLNQFILLANDGGSGTSGTSGFFDTSSVYDGPVHVNKNWALAGSPTFLAGASISDSYIWMNDPRNCSGFTFVKVSGKQSSPAGCTTPNTNGNGLQYSTPVIDLPKNAQSQERAALGSDATNLTAIPLATNPVTKEVGSCELLGLSPACNSIPNGTYVPTKGGQVSGGIYVQGNADIVMSTQGSNQVYTIKDSNNVTTVITVNYAAKTTTYLKGGVTTTLSGVPNGQLYVTGNINSLTGPPRTGSLPTPAPTGSVPSVIPPAVASASQLNIAAKGTVTISGDLTYTDDPRSKPGAANVLGIISGTDSVVIGDSAPNDVYLNGAILAGSTGDGLGVKSPGRTPARGAIHMLGSLAEDTDQLRGQVDGNGKATAGYSDDFKFDQRFFNGAVAPPFFPATTLFSAQTGWPIQRTWNEQ